MRRSNASTKPTLLPSVLLFSSATIFPAAPPELKVGDPAPPLRVWRWFTGSPFAKLDPGRVYVQEFWATWCAPCLSAMPHLGQLQAKHEKEGLTVIDEAVRDDAGAVEDFVAKRITFGTILSRSISKKAKETVSCRGIGWKVRDARAFL